MSDRTSQPTTSTKRSSEAEAADSAVIPGVLLPLRKQQRILLTRKPRDHVFLVMTGVLMVEARLPERDRQVLEILYTGDAYHTQDAPATLGAVLTAATPAEVQRYRPEALEAIERGNPEFKHRLEAAMAYRSARRTLHLASMSGANGDERLADFLVEIGLHLGRQVQGSRSFDIPLSREEIADYLALNPDTLSRIFSRLKSSGLLSVSRGRATISDWSALLRLSPLAAVQTELHDQHRETA